MPGHTNVELHETVEQGGKETHQSRWRVPQPGILRTAHRNAADGAA